MAMLLNDTSSAAAPSADDAQLALEASRVMARLGPANGAGAVRLRVETGGDSEEVVAIPHAAFGLLADILVEMSKGNAITVVPIHAELTTQQAADLLHVSRPFLIEQLEKGQIPFRKVGKHRRVQLADVMKYKHTMDGHRLQALEQLSAVDQELGLGY